MNKREKIIGIVMVGTIFIWAMTFFSKSRPAKPREPTRASSQKVPAKAVPREDGPKVSVDGVVALMEGAFDETLPQESITDPFEELKPIEGSAQEGAGPSQFVLSGIIIEKDEEPVALINGEILREGDVVAGFLVEDITPNEVVLTQGNERYILKLFVKIEDEG